MLLQGVVGNMQFMGKLADKLTSGLLMNSPELARDFEAATFYARWDVLDQMARSNKFTWIERSNIVALMRIRRHIDEQKDFLRVIIAKKNDVPKQLAQLSKKDRASLKSALSFIYLTLRDKTGMGDFFCQLMESDIDKETKVLIIKSLESIHHRHCEAVGRPIENLFPQDIVFQ